MQKTISIPVDQLLGGLDAKTLATALLERLMNGSGGPMAGRPITDANMPAIGQPWPGQGGTYAGICRGRDGASDYHLIVADEENDGAKWQAALKWAEKLTAGGHKDFTLPWRAEQAILFGNVPELFQKEYYWSRERRAEHSDYAWYQSFTNGHQDGYGHLNSLRARAVRRLAI